jgi:hypothetical protein
VKKKSRVMRWEVHVAHIGMINNAHKTFITKPIMRKQYLGDLGVEGSETD